MLCEAEYKNQRWHNDHTTSNTYHAAEHASCEANEREQ